MSFRQKDSGHTCINIFTRSLSVIDARLLSGIFYHIKTSFMPKTWDDLLNDWERRQIQKERRQFMRVFLIVSAIGILIVVIGKLTFLL